MSKFETTTTTTGREIQVRKNIRLKVFTIKTESGLYKTYPMGKDEFNSCLSNTGNDWQQFLRSEDYYKK
ncbi:MAG: hypothetical protein ACI8Q1_000236 [Parvicella sp.]|jgi:hypothetical protein